MPDFLLVHADKSVTVVNVKPAGKLADPQTAEAQYPARGFSIAQDVPDDVTGAYQRLIAAGYDSRLMKE